MQFARSKRFPTPPPDSVPPPGAYDVPVPSPVQPYKRAGMIEKSNRFGTLQDPNKPDTFGLYNPDGLATDNKENGGVGPLAKSTRSLAAHPADRGEKHKKELDRLAASHEKEVSKLKDKLAKLEQAKSEYKKGRDESSKERDGLKSEIRHLTSKLGKTTALLEKHQSALPSLQSKLEAMSASHAASASRKDTELATLRGRLSELEKRLSGEIERREEVTLERDEWERRARRERQGREEAATAAGEAVLRSRAEAHERDAQRLAELHASRMDGAQKERQLADRKAQVESLVAYASTLEARLALAEEERLLSERDARFVLFDAWTSERDLNYTTRAEIEKEWRQRARADGREMEGLRDEVRRWEREEEVLGLVQGELLAWEMERERSWQAEREANKKALRATEAELDTALNTDIPRLEGLLAASESSLRSTHDELAAAQSTISTLESDLAELQQRLVDETERLEGTVEEQRRLLSEGKKELEKERGEKRRVVGILAQTRASEGALKEEVDSLNREVTNLTPLLAQTDALQQTIDHLARLNAASEAEAQQLIAQNSELVGHSNQGQKIRHVAMIREELAESRKKHLATLSSLTAAQQKISNLEAELDTYRAVPATTRARVTRPIMDDAVQMPAPTPTPTPTVVVSAAGGSTTAAGSLAVPTAGVARRASLARSATVPTSSSSAAVSGDEPLSSVTFADDLAPLLPPQLAKSQPASVATLALPRGGAGAKSVGAATGAGAGGGGRRAGGARRESMGVKMEGRMSVSELF
ncbi:hypothetical protein JCM10908_005939 [Rhodotorula pacifica]|uniref:uncharacterized protein n=1 Tax=Rhodotorula pacifica TaxID=1495444 RepID=UPI00317478BA